MKRYWTAVGIGLLAMGMMTGCNDYNSSIQYNTGATVVNISPSFGAVGGDDFRITVNASPANAFHANSVVEWNGEKLATTVQDAITIYATVPKALIAKPGTAYVSTFTPQSGTGQNGLSNALTFIIYGTPNPVPTVSSVSPNSAPACGTNCGSVSVTITVTGTDFLPTSTNGGSSVTFANHATTNGQATALNVKSISATEITAVIPGTFLANADITGLVNVVNPASGVCILPSCANLVGGGPSTTPQPFTVTGSAAAGALGVAEETPALSQDGRFVVFSSAQNESSQIFMRDTCLGAANGCTPGTKLISATAEGTPGNGDSHSGVISSDGRYIAFSSAASNLAEGAPSGRQIYLHDTCFGAGGSCKAATSLVSTDSEGALIGTESILPSISASGRFIAFVAITPAHDAKGARAAASSAPTSAPNSGLRQVFVRDTCLGAANCTPKTTRISLLPGDAPGNSSKPTGPALSGLAKQIALAEGKNSTVFTPTVPVDDRVILALPKDPKDPK
jgi:WD40-like Beta Propeller Repeat